jgi:hypothetical protein
VNKTEIAINANQIKNMKTLNECIKEYGNQIQKGDIRVAYQGIIDFMMQLRTYFSNHYPECTVSGSIYQGYMDMTYFAFVPESFRSRKLKLALVFNHERITFEAWLAAVNKEVQTAYIDLLRAGTWDDCRISASSQGADSILEIDLVVRPDFEQPEALIKQIEQGVWRFVREIERFLFHETGNL